MPSGPRPTSESLDVHSRPTWWILLTITLAVVAVTFAHIGESSHSRPSSPFAVVPTNRDTRSAPNLPLHSSKVNGQSSSHAPLDENASNQKSMTGPATQNSPSPSTSSASTGGRTTEPVAAPTTGTETIYGYLSYPDNIESFIAVPAAAGVVTASAMWSTGASLELSIACSSSSQTMFGTAAVRVSVSAVNTPCTIRLYEQLPVLEPVPYTLNVLEP